MIVGYTMLHYGKDYLAYALQSLRDYVDKHVILYSATPTFGSHTDLPCPDTADELYMIADRVLGKKLIWRESLRQNYESVLTVVPDADLILEVDADEVWRPGLVGSILRTFRANRIPLGPIRLPMMHHWRSFNYVCLDSSWPVRLFNASRRIPWAGGWSDSPMRACIHHFGYARSVADTRYKIETSAHRGEWRAGWFDDVFLSFPTRLTDLHPVVEGMWNAEPYDRQKLPDFMHKHPWFNAEAIQ